MTGALAAALLATLAWVAAQNAAMHVVRTQRRLLAMLLGYVAGLPCVAIVFVLLPSTLTTAGGAESRVMNLFHAYFFHLMLFLLYVECFYHVERSVTLRFLVEILTRSGRGPTLSEIRSQYNVPEMIARRLEVLRQNRFVEPRSGRWFLLAKGVFFARVMQLWVWLFQSKTQYERM